jgi:hypothetical protein
VKKLLFSTLLLLGAVPAWAQPEDDLSKLLDESLSANETPDYATATFKTTRLINGHSNEQVAPGVLDMRISHRFGTFNSGAYNFFGLDQASMRMALEYGVFHWFTIGAGRSTYEKTYDGFVKFRILRQSSGKRTMPITLNVVSSMNVRTLKSTNQAIVKYPTSNYFYHHQLIIARKFSEGFSFMLAPTVVHRNLVQLSTDKHDLYSLGIGGRIKLTRRISFNAEYYYQFNRATGTTNCLSLGFDIETGGHVFQVTFTNAPAMIERGFITETTGRWDKGDIIGGFCISRNFTLVDPRRKMD